MSKSLVEMTADIVKAQSVSKPMTLEEITSALQTTFKILQGMQEREQGGVVAEEQISAPVSTIPPPEKSILKNKIVCLECGQEFKVLSKRHLESHGLDGREYRKKHGFKLSQPLSAKSLTESRKKAALARGGIPVNLRKAIEEKRKRGKS